MNRWWFELGGGLGDVIQQCFVSPHYCMLDSLDENNHATVLLVCHNPHCHELFWHHPKRRFFSLKLAKYCAESALYRHRYMEQGMKLLNLPQSPRTVFHCSSQDVASVSMFNRTQYVVFQPYAGLPDRTIPKDVVSKIVEWHQKRQLTLVVVGKNFLRHGTDHHVAYEDASVFDNLPYVVNMIDKLTIPATFRLLDGCRFYVGSHSSMNMYTWYISKVNYVLYSPETWKEHWEKIDQWSWAMNEPWLRHSLYKNFNVKFLDQCYDMSC